MTPDHELLRQYAEQGDQAAFAEVVRRHADLVYSAALRLANGDSALTQDVAQSVFTTMAQKAGELSRHATLVGWLHTTARYTASAAIRGEQRRRAREQNAAIMNEATPSPEPDWTHLRPVLDEAVGQLGAPDGEAVLLRFFQGKSHREVGRILGLNEDSARKRVERALDKMRQYFARRGVTVSATLLATTITANSVQAAPAGLAANWSATALSGKVMPGAGLAGKPPLTTAKLAGFLVAAALLLMVGLNMFRAAFSPGIQSVATSSADLSASITPTGARTAANARIELPAATQTDTAKLAAQATASAAAAGRVETRVIPLPYPVTTKIVEGGSTGTPDEFIAETAKQIKDFLNSQNLAPKIDQLAYDKYGTQLSITTMPRNFNIISAILRRFVEGNPARDMDGKAFIYERGGDIGRPGAVPLWEAVTKDGEIAYIAGPDELPAGAAMLNEYLLPALTSDDKIIYVFAPGDLPVGAKLIHEPIWLAWSRGSHANLCMVESTMRVPPGLELMSTEPQWPSRWPPPGTNPFAPAGKNPFAPSARR